MNLLDRISSISIGSSDVQPSESPYLPVLFIGTSQSRQHDKSESSAVTELVDLIEPHDHMNLVVDREHYCSRRLNDGIIMLEFIACSIPSWFSEVQLRLVTFNSELKIFNSLSNH
ncbi:hypothetical protein Tco_1280705 [Tanacetum coccineum]